MLYSQPCDEFVNVTGAESMDPIQLFWRSNAAVLRRGGSLLTRLAEQAYFRGSEPKLSSGQKNLLRQNEKLRGRHAGTRCFVIGNGPSLKKQDLAPLADEVTFVMNAFWKHPILETGWQPSYFCFADAVCYDGTDAVKQFFKSVRERAPAAEHLFPVEGKPVVERDALLPLQSTHFFAFQGQAIGFSVANTFDLTRPVPFPFSTAQLAIMAAMFMGCSPIYLMGLDHDWLAHRGVDTHFFSGRSLENHPTATGELNYSYESEIEAMRKLWKGYRKLSEFADAHGLKIFNATAGGFLDVFERVKYESVFD
jgi:hypothetical protein